MNSVYLLSLIKDKSRICFGIFESEESAEKSLRQDFNHVELDKDDYVVVEMTNFGPLRNTEILFWFYKDSSGFRKCPRPKGFLGALKYFISGRNQK